MSDVPSVHTAAAIGFDRAAAVYERARPSYPSAAVDHVIDVLGIAGGSRVLDLAAGTGKFTRLLVPSGAELVVVEPVAGMRTELSRSLPDIEMYDGTAEAIPLPDTSVDAVVSAQAFHWFDAGLALAEIHRVLRPGHGFAMVFNIRDNEVGWVRRLTEVTGVDTADRPHHSQTRQDHTPSPTRLTVVREVRRRKMSTEVSASSSILIGHHQIAAWVRV